jgi:hypothetical protein
MPIINRIIDFGNFNLLHNLLQFALAVITAISTPSGDPRFSDSAHVFLAFILFVTDEATARMLAQNQTQGNPPHSLQLGSVGSYHHSVLNRGGTRCG